MQLRSGGRSTFGRLESYVPLLDGETALYRDEAVPVVDAAICKLIRLTAARVACGNERAEQGCSAFCARCRWAEGRGASTPFWTVTSIRFLTCGRAVGEIVPDAEGREIAAVLCADVSQVEVREGDNPLDSASCVWMAAGAACRSSIRTYCSLHRSTPKWGTLTARFDAALDAVRNGAAAENLRRDGKETGTAAAMCALR